MSEIKNMDFATLIAECTAYEYKEMLEENKPKSWLKGVSAFANGMGSSLFFGVDNDRTAQGLGNIQKVSIQPLLGGVGICHFLSCSGKRFLLPSSLSSRILELEWGQERNMQENLEI